MNGQQREAAPLATVGLLRRAPALLIDAVPAAFLTALLFAVGALDARILRPEPGWFWTEWLLKFWLDDRGSLLAPLAVFALASIIWTTLWEVVASRTPGSRVVGLRVVDREGFDISTAQALLRGLGSLVNLATLGLGYLWVFVSRYRRGWHDLMAGSYVVRER